MFRNTFQSKALVFFQITPNRGRAEKMSHGPELKSQLKNFQGHLCCTAQLVSVTSHSTVHMDRCWRWAGQEIIFLSHKTF